MPTEREERQRRELRAMATRTRQLQLSGAGDGPSGVDPSVRGELREELERVNEAFVAARREKRRLERDLASLRNRRSVRAALRLPHLLRR